MDDFLLVDKPRGLTSHDVVARVRRVLRQASSHQSSVISPKVLKTGDRRLETPSPKVKVGHTGTLDPAATGLMILVIGKYTKKAGEFSKLDKTYEAEITLGKTSSTADSEGKITEVNDEKPSTDKVAQILNTFLGQIQQTPPAFSAIKVGGQRAYKLARAGKEVKMEPRKVTIYSLKLIDYKYPVIKVTAEVSSGTYIRSLAEDIGQKLGTGAYLSALRRTKVGKFDLRDATDLQNISKSAIV